MLVTRAYLRARKQATHEPGAPSPDSRTWETTNLPDIQLEIPVLANQLEVGEIARDHSDPTAPLSQRNQHIEVEFAQLVRLKAAIRLELGWPQLQLVLAVSARSGWPTHRD